MKRTRAHKLVRIVLLVARRVVADPHRKLPGGEQRSRDRRLLTATRCARAGRERAR
jgi:hypothetical protein